MDTKIKISVYDVDDVPVNNCAFTIAFGNATIGGNINGNEKVLDVTDSANGFTITVGRNHANYFDETTVIHPNRAWTNPTCSVVVSTETKLEDGTTYLLMAVRFVLSRIREAPTFEYPRDLNELAGAPTGILLSNPPNHKFDYKDMFGGSRENFHRLTEKIIGDPEKWNWDRLGHVREKKVTLSDNGKFRWLEYGTSKKYAIAIWIPHFDLMSANALDFIVFYSPTTFEKTDYDLDGGHSYPYGLKTHVEVDPKTGKPVNRRKQPFISQLGHRYLFDRLHLTFQLVAAKRRAIIVMPINNDGDWGPLVHKQGVHRLLLEIRHYVHKNIRIHPNIAGAAVAAPPIRSISIAGFSSGTKPIQAFFDKKSNIAGYDYVKDSSGFDNLWKEIWDLDLAINGTGKPWIENFKLFMANRPDRRVRMYHSDYTAGKDDLNEPKWRPSRAPELADLRAASKSPLTTTIPKRSNGGSKSKDSNILVEELHLMDGRWTIAYFSEEFLTPATTIETPNGKEEVVDKAIPPYNYGGKHDFMANIGFAHAALMSGLHYPR